MKISIYRAILIVAAVMLAACGGPETRIAGSSAGYGAPSGVFRFAGKGLIEGTGQGPRHVVVLAVQYKVSGPLLYVTNSDSPPYDAVTIYQAKKNNPSPIAVINENLFQPNGDCVDADGTLYVANEPGSSLGWVSEYALGKTKTLRVITQGINTPAFCAIDSDGNLWVTNIGGPTVTEYSKGSTTPRFTLRNGLTYPDGIAIDNAGNVYVGNLEPYGTSNVQVYPPGGTSPSRTITDGVVWPVGIGTDPNGTLYVTNDTPPCNIEKYRAGQSYPYQTISKDIDGPLDVSFAMNGRLFEVNAGVYGCASNGPWPVILEFRAGSLTPSKRMISNDLHNPTGVAYYPPLLP